MYAFADAFDDTGALAGTRLGQPKDLAAAVCFVASPLSGFMTGTTFRIDGGATPTVRETGTNR